VIVASAAVCGVTVAVIGAVCAGIVAVGRAVEPWRNAADRFVAMMAQPWLWLLLAAVLVVREAVAGRRAGAQAESAERPGS
jgi:hypothetical protein